MRIVLLNVWTKAIIRFELDMGVCIYTYQLLILVNILLTNLKISLYVAIIFNLVGKLCIIEQLVMICVLKMLNSIFWLWIKPTEINRSSDMLFFKGIINIYFSAICSVFEGIVIHELYLQNLLFFIMNSYGQILDVPCTTIESKFC